jgi:plastocyanin
MTPKRLVAFVAPAIVIALAMPVPTAATTQTTFVIGVDHADPANQQFAGTPPNISPVDRGRVFSYNDLFPREVTVHRGDILDFKPGLPADHVLAIAPNARAARAALPAFISDTDDPNAVGTGRPKIVLGVPIQIALSGANVCLPSGSAPPCSFNGSDVLINSSSSGSDWLVQVDANPGSYQVFDYFHPGLTGTIEVVPNDEPVSTVAEMQRASDRQFQRDQRDALALERRDDVVRFSEEDGVRTYLVRDGDSTGDGRVSLYEMLPHATLNLRVGDRVKFVWSDVGLAHSATTPPNAAAPVGLDCDSGFTPDPSATCGETLRNGQLEPQEFIFSPGNAASGVALSSLGSLGGAIDAGIHLGRRLGVPSSQQWTVKVDTAGQTKFNCTLHDWMQVWLNATT